jgi:plastocyanin
MMGVLAVAPPARAATPLVIGVDNASPQPACPDALTATSPVAPGCHNFAYLDFFPNGLSNNSITVHDGDVVQFKFNAGSPDGLHTATLLKPGETQADALGEFPFAANDSDGAGDAPAQQQFNPAILNGTFPPAGSGAPNACGDATTPCPYDASQDVNSGAPLQAIYYKVNLGNTSTVTVPFVCMIHPGMQGQLTVLAANNSAAGSTQAQLDSTAASQYNTETNDALAAESAANSAGQTANPDGTTTWRVAAGVDGANNDHSVTVLEMLPNNINIKPGDKVIWTSLSQPEIHTVTFPAGSASDSIDPFPFECETASGDQSITAPPCNPPPTTEVHFNPGPSGGTAIASPSTLATSGVIASAFPGSPSTYGLSFPNAGTFLYQCRVHDHMAGQVSVAAVVASPTAAPALPGSGSGPSDGPRSDTPLLIVALLSAMALVSGVVVVRGRIVR